MWPHGAHGQNYSRNLKWQSHHEHPCGSREVGVSQNKHIPEGHEIAQWLRTIASATSKDRATLAAMARLVDGIRWMVDPAGDQLQVLGVMKHTHQQVQKQVSDEAEADKLGQLII